MGRWVGIDQGYSHLAVAVADNAGAVLRSASTMEPAGNGHDRDLALRRLGRLLDCLEEMRDAPVHLAGYCYRDSGVREAFAERGWQVDGVAALNDVVGVYGLTEMPGHVVVAGCGSWSQTVYVDRHNSIRWAGGDAARALPDAELNGNAYSRFLRKSGLAPDLAEDDLLNAGFRLDALIDHPEVSRFVRATAEKAMETRDVFWRFSGERNAPPLAFGGGAVRGERIWRALHGELADLGVRAWRVVGDHAAGLARFAMANPTADPWGYVGNERPGWLA